MLRILTGTVCIALLAACATVGAGRSAPSAARGSSSAAVVGSLANLARRRQAQIPGALPSGYKSTFTDAYRGWPVSPVHQQHAVRGSFLDPRGMDNNGLSGYHFGIDVNVDDRHPEAGAGPGLSHRVYAVDGGTALVVHGVRGHTCANRRLEVGHFAYWHVSPVVQTGARIKPGQLIGWTCLGQWHVHVSEWRKVGALRLWLNPLRPGGKIAPFVSSEAPAVTAMQFFTPPKHPWHPTVSLKQPDTAAPLQPTLLHGRVELRARIGVDQSFWGFIAKHGSWETPHHPYRVGVEIRAHDSGAVILRRITFQADEYLKQTPYLVHFAPGTTQNASMGECTQNPGNPLCAGTYWFRPFSRHHLEYWNTRGVRNGTYDVTVVAWDAKGLAGTLTRSVVVAN